MKIMIATDGSACSEAAVREIARQDWPASSEVKVVSVIGFYTLAPPESFIIPENYYVELLKHQQEQARAAIEQAEAILTEANLNRPAPLSVSTEILSGDPREVIPQEARNWQADLLVVGSHGHRGLKKLWLGSVSQAILAHASCSVRIVRRPHPT